MLNSYLRFAASMLTLSAGLALGLSPAQTAAQTQDLSAQARVHFDEGNADFERAMRLRGVRRTQALQDALAHYASSLAITRSRNVVFNTGLAFEELERLEEAFSLFAEYAAMEGLSDVERAAGDARLNELRPRVAVVHITSTPPGAEVRIGRLDLPPAGTTPLETALTAGSHRLFVSLPHHEANMETVTAEPGERRQVQVTLRASPVGLRLEAPRGASLMLDGVPVTSGIRLRVAPGEHEVRMNLPGQDSLLRGVTLQPGAEDTVLRLEPPILDDERSSFSLSTNVSASLFIDGVMVSEGLVHEHRLSPGTHHVRVSAADHLSYTGEVTLEPDHETAAAITLVTNRDPIGERRRRTRIWSSTVAGILGVGAVTASLIARSAHQDWNLAANRYEASPTDENRRLGDEAATDLDQANLAADIFIGAGAAALTFALVSWLRATPPHERPNSRATFALHPTPHGAMLIAQGRIGDLQ